MRKARSVLLEKIIDEIGQDKYVELKKDGRQMYSTYESSDMTPVQFWKLYVIHWYKSHVTEQWDDKQVCVNQLVRPKSFFNRKPNHGYCPGCTTDPENNKYCSGYVPVKLRTFEVVVR